MWSLASWLARYLIYFTFKQNKTNDWDGQITYTLVVPVQNIQIAPCVYVGK